MKNLKIAIIGGGNLGSAIAKGLITADRVSPSNITITRRNLSAISHLSEFGVEFESNNPKAVAGAQLVMLAVKPYLIDEVAQEISPYVAPGTIVVSLAAGITSARVAAHFNQVLPVFCVMPNTAIAIGESMTFVSSFQATKEHEALVMDLFNQMGTALLIPEAQMAAATVLASCGIAYAMRYIRASMEGGVQMGFTAALSQQIVTQTVKGAAQLIAHSGNHPEAEIDRVTTPGGITIEGLNEMEHKGFTSSVIKGLMAAFNKVKNAK
ncbi:pyrroline-5-carboxylate reductase [Breznakibacter xylanolyticus]|uniref:Pyrroline-5-carboxylate reductase n=1 Tax=Breznakibacter xylanolyticus TaxID=990 RepID=A0A2W7NVY4_9BACT|nr:pyrroline-5-carboxylate reductase [Breznakibacter xylanolyticus]PZX17466.1 pyrroline-5-carboxylate reductase [Breznakibacter xylanolyticus]